MGLSDAAFEEWLRVTVADGTAPRSRRDIQRDDIFLDVLGRLPDGGAGSEGVEADLAMSAAEVEALRAALKSSLERLVSNPWIHGAVSHDFRHLTAASEMAGLEVSTEAIAECIASYRVVLGRSADPAGFITFVTSRRSCTLAEALAVLLGSAEAAERFGEVAPSPQQATLAVEAAAIAVGIAAAVDASLGSLLRLRSDVQTLAASVGGMGAQVDRIEQLLHLRLDATASMGHTREGSVGA